MTFILQCIILCIGIGIFVLQHHIKRHISIIASKLVYWTTLLFMGGIFNRLLYEVYPENYTLSNYYTIENLIIVASLVGGFIVLQLASPTPTAMNILNRWFRIKPSRRKEEQEYIIINKERNEYLKELHFETFLETICWLGFIFSLVIEILFNVVQYMPELELVFRGLRDAVCIIMVLSIPIALRQIIFYLHRVRLMKEEENLPELEIRFQKKLRKKNMYL